MTETPAPDQAEPVHRGLGHPRPNVHNSGPSQPLNPVRAPSDQHAGTSPQSVQEGVESLARLVELNFSLMEQLQYELQYGKDIDDLLALLEPNKTVFIFDEKHILIEEDIQTQHAIMNSIKTQHDDDQAKDRPAASRVPPLFWYLAGGIGIPPTREGMKKMVQDIGVWRLGREYEA